jgi:hypothetical protein
MEHDADDKEEDRSLRHNPWFLVRRRASQEAWWRLGSTV